MNARIWFWMFGFWMSAFGALFVAILPFTTSSSFAAEVSASDPAQIADALAQARDAGAELALVSGSGPTVLGLFPAVGRSPGSGLALAQAAAAGLATDRRSASTPAPICATPVDGEFALPVTLAAGERRPGTSQSAEIQ